MTKEESIISYYEANRSYLHYLFKIFEIDNVYSNDIFIKGNISGAMIGCISNILLSIKEDIIINTGNLNYESNLYGNLLEKSVLNIANKVDDGYEIYNYKFKDLGSLVATLRNKIAHGDFLLDLPHNKIILLIEQKEVKINITKLTNFIISLFQQYLKNRKVFEYKRSFLSFNKCNKNRKEPIRNDSEIRNIIKNIENIKFTLKRKNQKPIEKSVLDKFEIAYSMFQKDQKQIHISNLKKELDSDYELIMEKTYYDKDLEPTITYLKEHFPKNLDYEGQIYYIILELNKNYDSLISNLNNLILLSTLNKHQTSNIDKLKQEISNKYDTIVYFSNNNLVSTSISMFNALFSYGFDDYYKDSLEFKNLSNSSLDYSLLDLSLLNPTLVNPNISILDDNNQKLNGLIKDFNNLKEKKKNCINNLKNVSQNNNTLAIKKINENLKEIENNIATKKEQLNELKQYIQNLQSYINKNKLHLTNKAIIEGIRNSIAHGNYEIENNFNETKIIFTDLYEGVVTFKLEVKLLDFINTLEINENVIKQYITKNNLQNKHNCI